MLPSRAEQTELNMCSRSRLPKLQWMLLSFISTKNILKNILMSTVTYFQNRNLPLGFVCYQQKLILQYFTFQLPSPKQQPPPLISLISGNVLLCPNKHGNQFSFKYAMNSRVRCTKDFLCCSFFQVKDILVYLNWMVVVVWFGFQRLLLILPLNKQINK